MFASLRTLLTPPAQPALLGLVLSAGLLAAMAPVAVSPAAAAPDSWASYRNARHGFMIAYPEAVFAADPANESEDGRMLVSRDGSARLLVGAFRNEDGLTLKDYRAFLIEKNYAGATLDYAPVRDRWFVLSGTRDGTMFYERVSFTCGGGLINSWAMIYPAAARRTYDRIVERVAKSYVVGAGRDGRCE